MRGAASPRLARRLVQSRQLRKGLWVAQVSANPSDSCVALACEEEGWRQKTKALCWLCWHARLMSHLPAAKNTHPQQPLGGRWRALHSRRLSKRRQPEQSHAEPLTPLSTLMNSPGASDSLSVPWHQRPSPSVHKTATTNERPMGEAVASWKQGHGRCGWKRSPREYKERPWVLEGAGVSAIGPGLNAIRPPEAERRSRSLYPPLAPGAGGGGYAQRLTSPLKGVLPPRSLMPHAGRPTPHAPCRPADPSCPMQAGRHTV